MQRRNVLLPSAAIAAAAAIALRPAATVLAGAEWCSDDPVVVVRVDGTPLAVNVRVQVRREDVALLHTARAVGAADGSTVTVTLHGPAAPFKSDAIIRRLSLHAGDPHALHAAGASVTLTFRDVRP